MTTPPKPRKRKPTSPAKIDESDPLPAEDVSHLPAKVESILERLPAEDRPKAEMTLRQIVAQYSGPVPHAAEMERYRRVDPSFPERFVKMAEGQVAHRQSLETKLVDDDFKIKRRGQDYAMIAMVLGMGVALLFGIMGLQIVAGIVGGTTVVGVVTAFVTGRVIESRSNEPDHEGKE